MFVFLQIAISAIISTMALYSLTCPTRQLRIGSGLANVATTVPCLLFLKNTKTHKGDVN